MSDYTDTVRELAEAVRNGYVDPHHVAEALRGCAASLDESDALADARLKALLAAAALGGQLAKEIQGKS